MPPLVALLCIALAAPWQMRVEDDATMRVVRDGAPLLRSTHHFWGDNWRYAGSRFTIADDGETFSMTGRVEDMGLTVRGGYEIVAPDRMVMRYVFTAERDVAPVIGGGLQFELNLDSPALADDAAPPQLLDDQRGFRWPVGGADQVMVRFDPPVAQMYFEQGRRETIRAMFFAGHIPAGEHVFEMTVTLPPDAAAMQPLSRRYQPINRDTWHRNVMDPDRAPIDLSFLNDDDRPAGRRGFVRADGDRLIFADGAPARFWGTNVCAYALFDEPEQIKTQAKRIAQLGYNLVRMHHHDSMRWVDPTVIDKQRDDSQALDAAALERLHWWVKCLKDEGVYVWIDLHVGRVFKPDDGIDGFDELTRRRGEGVGFCYFNDRLTELMQRFNADYLSRENRFTGMPLVNDPAVVGVLVTNENDLTHHYGNMMLPDKNNPVHQARFEAALRAFCERTGLPRDRAWRTWEHGPSKLFLADVEHHFNRAMIDHLRGIGLHAPIATTNTWGNMTLAGLPSLTDGDVIDAHSYGGEQSLSTNPHYEPNFITWIGAAQVHGKPLTITEWNVPYPAVDRFTAPLYVASIGCLQGWDAPMVYCYAQGRFGDRHRVHQWSTYYDPAITAVMPAAAITFRQQHISEAKRTIVLSPGAALFDQRIDPTTSALLRAAVETSRLAIAMPATQHLDWLESSQAGDTADEVVGVGRTFVVSDTGQLRRDWTLGVQTIDTPRTQAAQGWIGNKRIELSAVTMAIDTPQAVVAVTSLDGEPIASSRRMLVTTVARVVAEADGRMPFYSEPVVGRLSLRSAVKGLVMRQLDSTGRSTAASPLVSDKGGYVVELSATDSTHWRLIEAP